MDDSNNVFGQKPNNYSPEINVPPVSTPQPPVTVPLLYLNHPFRKIKHISFIKYTWIF